MCLLCGIPIEAITGAGHPLSHCSSVSVCRVEEQEESSMSTLWTVTEVRCILK